MFDYTTRPWSKLAIKAQLPILTDEQRAARQYLVDTITQERQMLQYLQAYQHQNFYASRDSFLQADVNMTVTDYQKMVTEYNNYNIIDSCYGDTENINTRCIYAANQVKQMQERYKNSIEKAHALSFTIASWTENFGELILVPVHAWPCIKDSCENSFVVYDASIHDFLPQSFCMIDTTVDNSYFKLAFPSQVGKSLFCIGAQIRNTNGFYVYRSRNYTKTGIGGRLINGKEVNFPVLTDGLNTEFDYSESTTFKYNPI